MSHVTTQPQGRLLCIVIYVRKYESKETSVNGMSNIYETVSFLFFPPTPNLDNAPKPFLFASLGLDAGITGSVAGTGSNS